MVVPENAHTGGGGVRAWLEIMRPFSLTASLVPVLVGGALAWRDGRFEAGLFLLILVASILLQAGTNTINELFDVKNGVDRPESPRASKVVVQGRLSQDRVYRGSLVIFGIVIAIGAYFVYLRGWPLLALGLLGVVAGYFYTAPPFHYKYRALGVPMVFILMGPVMVLGTYLTLTGEINPIAVMASIPVGFLVAAILHANEVRDIQDDAVSGFVTLSMVVGQRQGSRLYIALVLGAYLMLAVLVVARLLPPWSLITVLVLPGALRAVRTMNRGVAAGEQGELARIDQATAQIHLQFGVLLALAFVLQGLLAGRIG